ncbi:activity-regulated cytoskeleton-associated protein-like [Dermacentor albipictus]|uniref:activity-regulated cytoskeleton-associated protein-like n=1 Tax=Dermacentor albipictus TaxID=60249 RepID=UPI0038FC9184
MSTPIILQQPRGPPTFNGSLGEDSEEWLDQFERVASFNKWDDAAKIGQVFFSLEGSARTWYENHESSLTTWELFKRELLKVVSIVTRKERAERLLEPRIQLPNEPVRGYVEEMKRIFRRADLEMTEEKKFQFLMRGVKEQLFGSLVRQLPKTAEEFMQEASTIEKTLDVRAWQYNRPSSVCAIRPDTTTTTSDNLREVIREIVREELRRLLPSSAQPQAATLMDVVREEVR